MLKNILLFCVLVFSSQLVASDWPDMPFPQNATINPVSSSMIFNGVPMKTWVIKSDRSIGEVASFYRSAWQPIADSLFDEKSHAGQVFINSKQDGFLLTAKLDHQLGVTTGYLGISHFEERILDFQPGRGFPLPRGTTVINDITESDPHKAQRFLLLSTQKNVADTYRFYLKKFEQQWLVKSASVYPEKGGAAIALNRDNEELNIVIAENGNTTQVTVNKVKRLGF